MRPPARAAAAHPDIRAAGGSLTAVPGLALALVIVTALGARILAHDLERTAVTLTIEPDGRFDLIIENDPNWLLLRLERFAVTTTLDGSATFGTQSQSSPTAPADATGAQVSTATAGSLSAAERDARLTALAAVFIDRVVLFVDRHEIRPDEATYVPPTTEEAPDGRPTRAAFRLRGSLPADARSLRWYYGLVIDPYPITIHRADGRDVSDLVLGDAWSGPLDLEGPLAVPNLWQVARQYFGRGFAELLPRGIAHVLFVLALVVGGAPGRLPPVRLAAFAGALSLGLSVVALGLSRLPLQLTDLLVALSILYVGLDNLVAWRASVVPIALAGLAHGARLAHGVIDANLLSHHATTSLLSLNLGVAAGELSVVLIGVACLASFRGCSWYRSRVVVPTSIALGSAGMYWLVRSIAA